MGLYTETPQWVDNVYLLEVTDSVVGGPDGISNLQAKQLADRTARIKQVLEDSGIFLSGGTQLLRGQTLLKNAYFEGVLQNQAVYFDPVSGAHKPAIADGTEKDEVIGIADVAGNAVIVSGLFSTTLNPNPGTPLFLSTTQGGALTTEDTGVHVGTYLSNGVARFDSVSEDTHNHDSRYYTKEETDTFVGDSAPLIHTHDSDEVSGLTEAVETYVNSIKGTVNGIAPLVNGKVPTQFVESLSLTDVFEANSEAEQLALVASEGSICVRSDLSETYIHNGGTAGTMADWTLMAGAVTLQSLGLTNTSSSTTSGAYRIGVFSEFTNTTRSDIQGVLRDFDFAIVGKASSTHNHDGVYATAAHTHANYASTTHNHDTAYSAANHLHSGVYATAAHTHADYALTAHNHDSAYSASTHNHDSAYATAGHSHANYSLTTHTHTQYAATVHTHADYSLTSHNHSTTYSDINHQHQALQYSGTNKILATATGGTVSGTLSATAFSATSARRFKDNIRPLDQDEVLGALQNVRGVRYDFIGGRKNDLGMIAEEMMEVFPEFVSTDESGQIMGIDYGRVTSVLVEAVKALTTKVSALEAAQA